ncbi:hypothetical protein pb186bvf_018835 [Paramecium bursaria]
MKKGIGYILLVHSAISLIRYRKHQVFNNQPDFNIPLDILLEIIIGIALNFILGIAYGQKFKNIHEFKSNKTYDQSFNRPNFKSPGGRGAVLQGPLRKQIGKLDFFK